MRTTFAVLAVLTLTLPASAEPQVLIDLWQRGNRIVSYSGQPIDMEFVVGGRHAIRIDPGRIEHDYTTADIGQEFHAAPAELAKMEYWLKTSDGVYHWDAGQSTTQGGGDVDDLWNTEGNSPNFRIVTPHVPRLGVGLNGYDITDITQTVESLRYEQTGIYTIHSFSTARLRIYGQVIPEPATWLLVTMMGMTWLLYCRR